MICTIIKTLVANSGKKGKGIEPRGGGRDRLTQQHEVRVLSTYRCRMCVLARRKLNSIKKAYREHRFALITVLSVYIPFGQTYSLFV